MNLKNQRGLSLVEMLFTVAILGLLIGGIAKFFSDSQNAVISTENRADLAAISQVIDSNLRQSLMQNERLYCGLTLQGNPGFFDTFVNAVYAGVSGSASHAPLPMAGRVMPELITANNLSGVTYVAAAMGNSILFLATVSPLRLTGVPATLPAVVGASPTPTPIPVANTPLTEVLLDRYQFVYIYPAMTGKKIPNLPGQMRIVEWRSKPYVSFTQLSKMPPGRQLTNTVQSLVSMGYDYAFDSSANSVTAAFYALSNVSPYFTPLTSTTVNVIPENAWGYMDEYTTSLAVDPQPNKPKGRVSRQNFSGGVSGFPSTYSLAYNSLSPTVNPGMKVNSLLGGVGGRIQVPVFANASTDTASAFPGGLEIGIFGGTNKREIWARTVVMAVSAGNGAAAVSEKNYTASEGLVDITTSNPE